MRRFTILFFLLPFAIAGIFAQAATTSSDQAQVIASERAWIKATVAGDADAMASYMADDYVELSLSNGTSTRRPHWDVTPKAEWVNAIRSKREKYQWVNLSDIKVYLHGNVATLTAYYAQKGVHDHKSVDSSGIYVETWVRKDARWRVVSSAFP